MEKAKIKFHFKISAFIFFSLLCFIFLNHPCLAARVRKRLTRQNTSKKTMSTQGVKAWVRLRSDRRALLINFSRFDNLASARYELIYTSNGVIQGLGGSVILGDTSTKTLVFGTESGGVFNYHTNISNARLSIYSTLIDGTVVLKPYRIKI